QEVSRQRDARRDFRARAPHPRADRTRRGSGAPGSSGTPCSPRERTVRRLLGVSLAVVAMLLAVTTLRSQDAERRRGFSVEITAPADGSFVFGKTQITASVKIADPRDIASVEFFVGDKLVFLDKEAPYECVFDFGEVSKSWVVRAVAHHRENIDVSDQ